MNSNKEIYDLILRKKEELLTIENPVQFIFSHSALGVGWDNPNVFNIATLNNSYSDIKKRQEIGRGLRIAVNQEGNRIYDGFDVSDDERINELTVVPNETYETFVSQYQDEIKAAYGDTKDAPPTKHTHKGESKNTVKVKLNENAEIQAAFRRFWQKISRKTDYTVSFDEEKIIEGAVDESIKSRSAIMFWKPKAIAFENLMKTMSSAKTAAASALNRKAFSIRLI